MANGLSPDLASNLISLMIENNTTSSRLDIENFYLQSPTSDFFESNVMAFVKANASEINTGKVYQLYANSGKTSRCTTADTNRPPSTVFMEISKNENAAAIGPDSTSGDESAAIVADIMGTTGVQVAARTNLNNVLLRAIGQFHSDSNATIDMNETKVSNAATLDRGEAATSRAFLHLLAIITGRSDSSAWTQAQQAISLVGANLEPVVKGVDGQELSPHDVGGNCLWYYWPDAVAVADRTNTNLTATDGTGATQGAPTTLEFKIGSASAAVPLATAAFNQIVLNLLATNVGTSIKKPHARLDFNAGTASRDNAILAALYYSGQMPASTISGNNATTIGTVTARAAQTVSEYVAAEKDADINTFTSEQGKWALNAFTPKLSATSGATYYITTELTTDVVLYKSLAGSDTVMPYIRTQTPNSTTYQIWDGLLDAAWPTAGEYQVTGSTVSYPNTALFLFTNFINLAKAQGAVFTKTELNAMIGTTATGNWGKLNSSTMVIAGQASNVQIKTLTGSLMSGYNEYKLFQSGANGQSDITTDDIVDYLLNASGGTYDAIVSSMVVAMITNALTKDTREFLMKNLGILGNALRIVYKKKETPPTNTEDLFVQILLGAGATGYNSNTAYGTVGFTLAASVRTEIMELKALLRTGATFDSKGLYNFSWGQGLLNKWGAAGLFRIVPGAVSTSGVYDGGVTGDFFEAKDSIAVDAASLLVHTALTGLANKQSFALVALSMVQEAMKSGSENIDLVKVKTSVSKEELTVGIAQVVGTTLKLLNGGTALTNDNLTSLLLALSSRDDFDKIKREFAIGAGHAQNAGGIYGAVDSGPSGISAVFTVGFNQANTVTYSQDNQTLCAKVIQDYFWSCLSLIKAGDTKATATQTANKGSQDTMVEILNMIFNLPLVSASHVSAVQRASLLDMLRVYAFGPALALVSLDTAAAKVNFNAAINAYVSTANTNANHPSFDMNDKAGAAITSLTLMIPKATASTSAAIVAVNDEVLNYAYANPGFDLNKALVSGIAANSPLLMVSAYLLAQGINGEDQFPEDQVLEDDEVAVLVQAGVARAELLKMVAVEFNINGYEISNEETRRVMVRRSR